MISWIAILGQTIEFIVTKYAGKTLELKLDEKKSACKAFVRLHDALEEAETFTANAISNLQAMLDPRKPSTTGWAQSLPEKLRTSTREFEGALTQVVKSLSIYDPNLSQAFGLIRQVKMRTHPLEGVLAAADFLYTRKPGTEPDEFAFTEPDEQLIHSFADALQENYNSPDSSPNAGRRLTDVVTGHSTRLVISRRDRPALLRLYNGLQTHLALLNAAREGLQAFIKQQFSLADLLYVTKGQPSHT